MNERCPEGFCVLGGARDQGYIGQTAVSGEMGAVIDSQMTTGLVGGWNRRVECIGILGRSSFVSEKADTIGPCRVVKGRRIPGRAPVGAGIIPTPIVRNVQQFEKSAGDIGDRNRATIRRRIWSAGGRLRKVDKCVATAGTASLGNICDPRPHQNPA